jgi:hypothetical protein
MVGRKIDSFFVERFSAPHRALASSEGEAGWAKKRRAQGSNNHGGFERQRRPFGNIRQTVFSDGPGVPESLQCRNAGMR